MSKKKRCGLSAEQKALLWQRWKDGESLSDIGRSLGKHAANEHAGRREGSRVIGARVGQFHFGDSPESGSDLNRR
ncbi:hypothetical protein [Burkholderia ubonensis]|uniref:hypothetical protein n=1 Tax=Burkholderia ubonensis TaxID=101571 RepID=UPI0012F7F09A|nr:hypothetical protein [Burkholderia ubonensis]